MKNDSSLLTYDSPFLVNNFLYLPKHDSNFQPLFPEEVTLSPSQAAEVAKLCGEDRFCSFDVAATGHLSVGNATRVAHQQHLHHLHSLQPGEGGGRVGQGLGTSCWGRAPQARGCRQQPAAGVCHLCPAPTPVVSCGWLAPPRNGFKEGIRYLMGSTVHFHCDSGYSLVGAEASTCLADGTWSGSTPTCQPGEDALPVSAPLPCPAPLLSPRPLRPRPGRAAFTAPPPLQGAATRCC